VDQLAASTNYVNWLRGGAIGQFYPPGSGPVDPATVLPIAKQAVRSVYKDWDEYN